MLSSASLEPANPDSVFERTGTQSNAELNQYESLLLTLLDGRNSIADIQSGGFLTSEEIELALLTLEDKGLIGETSKDPDPPAATGSVAWLADDLILDEKLLDDPSPLEGPRTNPARVGPAIRPEAPVRTQGTIKRRLRIPRIEPIEDQAQTERDGLVRLARVAAAQQLFQAAQRDRDLKSVVSARMNLKLACGLDPANDVYKRAFEELSEGWKLAPRVQAQDTPAWKLYEEACQAERLGDLDGAVRYLEAALQLQPHGAFYNRLGVLLATKKNELQRGELMLRKAIEIDPNNNVYIHNLARVLGAMALKQKPGRSKESE